MSNVSLIKSNGMNAMDDNKSKALTAALAQIEKQFGKGSIMKMGEAQVKTTVGGLDRLAWSRHRAGRRRLPRGRVVEIYGPESSGKTTLCLQVVAQVQKAGGTAAYIDAETRSIRSTRENWASTSARCLFRSPIPASRASKSLTCWFARAASTSSSSTRSRRWCPRRRSKARWATSCPAFRRG